MEAEKQDQLGAAKRKAKLEVDAAAKTLQKEYQLQGLLKKEVGVKMWRDYYFKMSGSYLCWYVSQDVAMKQPDKFVGRLDMRLLVLAKQDINEKTSRRNEVIILVFDNVEAGGNQWGERVKADDIKTCERWLEALHPFVERATNYRLKQTAILDGQTGYDSSVIRTGWLHVPVDASKKGKKKNKKKEVQRSWIKTFAILRKHESAFRMDFYDTEDLDVTREFSTRMYCIKHGCKCALGLLDNVGQLFVLQNPPDDEGADKRGATEAAADTSKKNAGKSRSSKGRLFKKDSAAAIAASPVLGLVEGKLYCACDKVEHLNQWLSRIRSCLMQLHGEEQDAAATVFRFGAGGDGGEQQAGGVVVRRLSVQGRADSDDEQDCDDPNWVSRSAGKGARAGSSASAAASEVDASGHKPNTHGVDLASLNLGALPESKLKGLLIVRGEYQMMELKDCTAAELLVMVVDSMTNREVKTKLRSLKVRYDQELPPSALRTLLLRTIEARGDTGTILGKTAMELDQEALDAEEQERRDAPEKDGGGDVAGRKSLKVPKFGLFPVANPFLAMNIGIWPPIVGQFVEARFGVTNEIYNELAPRGLCSAKKLDDVEFPYQRGQVQAMRPKADNPRGRQKRDVVAYDVVWDHDVSTRERYVELEMLRPLDARMPDEVELEKELHNRRVLHDTGPEEPSLQADLKTWYKICSRQPRNKSPEIRKAEKTLCRVFDLEQSQFGGLPSIPPRLFDEGFEMANNVVPAEQAVPVLVWAPSNVTSPWPAWEHAIDRARATSSRAASRSEAAPTAPVAGAIVAVDLDHSDGGCADEEGADEEDADEEEVGNLAVHVTNEADEAPVTWLKEMRRRGGEEESEYNSDSDDDDEDRASCGSNSSAYGSSYRAASQQERIEARKRCIKEPTELVGWRVDVQRHGRGRIVSMETGEGVSTKYRILFDDGQEHLLTLDRKDNGNPKRTRFVLIEVPRTRSNSPLVEEASDTAGRLWV